MLSKVIQKQLAILLYGIAYYYITNCYSMINNDLSSVVVVLSSSRVCTKLQALLHINHIFLNYVDVFGFSYLTSQRR